MDQPDANGQLLPIAVSFKAAGEEDPHHVAIILFQPSNALITHLSRYEEPINPAVTPASSSPESVSRYGSSGRHGEGFRRRRAADAFPGMLDPPQVVQGGPCAEGERQEERGKGGEGRGCAPPLIGCFAPRSGGVFG